MLFAYAAGISSAACLLVCTFPCILLAIILVVSSEKRRNTRKYQAAFACVLQPILGMILLAFLEENSLLFTSILLASFGMMVYGIMAILMFLFNDP